MMKFVHFCFISMFFLGTFTNCGSTQKQEEEAIETSVFHYQLAIGYFQAHEIPASIRELFTSLEHNPNNGNALFMLGFLYQGRFDYEEAERYYLAALEVMPEFYEIRNNLGTVYLAQERWDEAEAIYRELTRIPTYSTPGHAHNNLGWALYQQDDPSSALQQFELAVMFQPEHCVAYNNAGIIHAERGHTRDAQRAFEQAISRCDDYNEAFYRLGTLLTQNGGDLVRAQELFQTCYEIAPDSRYGQRCAEYLENTGW